MSNGLSFELRTRPQPAVPARADVAAFVGMLGLRWPDALPADVRAQWRHAGFGAEVPSDPSVPPARPLPIAVESVAAFDALFDGWVGTPEGLRWESYAAGAVRDFFRQGGRRAWIVPALPLAAPPREPAEIAAALARLVPSSSSFAADDRSTWHGLGHLVGLPEVATVCMPDLPNLLGAPLQTAPPEPPEAVAAPQFLECSQPDPRPPLAIPHRAPLAPRLDAAHFERWQVVVRAAIAWLARHRSDVQLLVALPLWDAGAPGESDPLVAGLGTRLRAWSLGGLASARLQLAYPWVRCDTSLDRPSSLAPADGILAGLIARSTLAGGAFQPATQSAPAGIVSLAPALSPHAVRVPRAVDMGGGRNLELSLMQRVSLIAPTPGGFRVISDVTTAPEPGYRQAGVARLLGLLRRAFQRIGETVVFESSGPRTWRRLRERVVDLLEALRAEGAFADGRNPYAVRCDRTTMTQNDIDGGRVIAHVEVTPAQTVEHITVVLQVEGSGGGASVRDGSGG